MEIETFFLKNILKSINYPSKGYPHFIFKLNQKTVSRQCVYVAYVYVASTTIKLKLKLKNKTNKKSFDIFFTQYEEL